MQGREGRSLPQRTHTRLVPVAGVSPRLEGPFRRTGARQSSAEGNQYAGQSRSVAFGPVVPSRSPKLLSASRCALRAAPGHPIGSQHSVRSGREVQHLSPLRSALRRLRCAAIELRDLPGAATAEPRGKERRWSGGGLAFPVDRARRTGHRCRDLCSLPPHEYGGEDHPTCLFRE